MRQYASEGARRGEVLVEVEVWAIYFGHEAGAAVSDRFVADGKE